MLDPQTYIPGAWVVHRHHGVGQVKSKETKHIAQQENTYFKIQTFNSTIWLPENKMNDEWLRPIATLAEVKRALKVLRAEPQPMSDNLNTRKSRIQKIESNAAPAEIAELVRDLWSLKKKKKGLPQVEEAGLRHLTECFLAEWAVSGDMTIDEAKQRLDKLLRASYKKYGPEAS